MRATRLQVSVVIAALLVAGSGATATARVLRVGTCPGARFTSIQNAIDAARNRDAVLVCTGVYDEQLVIEKRIKIRGERGAILSPSSMVANTTSLRTGEAIAAVVVVEAKTKVQALEIDASGNGLGCSGGDPTLIGVFFRGASGTLRDSAIRGARLADADLSCDSGAAVVVQGTGANRIKVTVRDNVISDYQRAGVVVNEAGARARIRGNAITGLGPTPQVTQNGIQVGFGASAKITKNIVQNNAGPAAGSCAFDGGNLIFEANRGVIAGNTFTGNTAGVYVSGSKNLIQRNRINGRAGGVPAGLDGILLLGDANVVSRNEINEMSAVGIRVLGNANRISGNVVTGTRAASLCEAARATPGCSDLLDVCGVGVWIAQGSDNRVANNTLVGNDVDVLDEGVATTVRRSGR